jgi:hypothetical protein
LQQAGRPELQKLEVEQLENFQITLFEILIDLILKPVVLYSPAVPNLFLHKKGGKWG